MDLMKNEGLSYGEFKDKLEVFYPGVYTPEEQAAIDAWKAGTYQSKRPGPAMGMNGERDGVIGPIHGNFSKLYAHVWDKYNPLWFDPEFARANGWADTPVRPGYISAENMLQLPDELGENANFVHDWVIGDAYDHEVEYLAPIYPGDTLKKVLTRRDFIDATDPQGGHIRALVTVCTVEYENQKGERVFRAISRYPSFKYRSLDPEFKAPFQHAFGRYVHPEPEYSDEDWEIIKGYMLGEKVRKEPLYWEDVQIGQEPTPICEGPIEQCDMIRLTGYQLVESNLRDQFENGGHGHFAKMQGGHYTNMSASHVYKDHANWFNFTGRNLGVRLVSNWAGPTAFIAKCAWRMINDDPPETATNHLPESYARPSWLFKVPALKQAGRYMNLHGFCGDLGLMKGYVSDKYIQDGKHYVELVVWGENLDGGIWQETLFTVILPSREDNQ